MSTAQNAASAHPATAPQHKALRVAAIIRERMGVDCLAAELLESQHARIAALEARPAALSDEMLQTMFDQFRAQHPESTARFTAFNWFMAGATIADVARAAQAA